MPDFKHPLCQNEKQWEGFTVFKLRFNDVPVEFVTLADAKYILRKSKQTGTRPLNEKNQLKAAIAIMREKCGSSLQVNELAPFMACLGEIEKQHG